MKKLFYLILIPLFTLISCSNDDDSNKGSISITDNPQIFGKWEGPKDDIDFEYIEFNSDGVYRTKTRDSKKILVGSYLYFKNKLSIKFKDTDGTSVEDTSDCIIQGDKLILNDGTTGIIFTKL